MANSFGETLRRLRMEKGLSQQQLADRLYVERPSVANWEGGRRFPDAATVSQLAEILGVDTNFLFSAATETDGPPHVLLVDDEQIILTEWLSVLRKVLPGTDIVGFTKPSQALAFAAENPVALAFLDIELGRSSGLDLCRELLRIHPRTNVIFLTAYRDYAFDAWSTGASGFLLKPLDAEEVRKQLTCLRYPVRGLL